MCTDNLFFRSPADGRSGCLRLLAFGKSGHQRFFTSAPQALVLGPQHWVVVPGGPLPCAPQILSSRLSVGVSAFGPLLLRVPASTSFQVIAAQCQCHLTSPVTTPIRDVRDSLELTCTCHRLKGKAPVL